MFVKKEDREKILSATKDKFFDLISEYTPLSKKGGSHVGKCPNCGHEKGLTVTLTTDKQIAHCFKCGDFTANTAAEYLWKGQNMLFPEALMFLADKYSVDISKPKIIPKNKPKKGTPKSADTKKVSFCTKMLKESGLDKNDTYATTYVASDKKVMKKSHPFSKGTLDRFGNIDINGDDVIIKYYDLEGFPVTYEVQVKGKLTGKMREYYRVRWQYPEEHLNQEGKPFKYKSPFASGTHIYFPERIREKYHKGEEIPTLFIQEGEKKAEKACKHDIPSIAVSGIQNIGKKGRLPEDIIRLVEKCNVKEVVFMLDSDWNDLSRNIKISESVDRRPNLFFRAVSNYKDYFRTLVIRALYVEIYFGYVLKNDKEDKGVDDLLTNTLSGKEDELKKDIDRCKNEKSLLGSYVQLHKISTITEHKLRELWSLHNSQEFALKHKDVLESLPEFIIGRHKWRFNKEGEIESTQPIESDEKYWEEIIKTDKNDNETKTYKFRYGRCFQFLKNRGFGRYRKLDGSFEWIKLDIPTVRTVQPWEIRDFLTEFTKMVAHEDVLEMIYCGGPQYLGPDKLSNLTFVEPCFEKPTRDKQIFYFKKKCWEITADKMQQIDYTDITHQIWFDVKQDRETKLLKPLINVKKVNAEWSYTISADGENSHFLKFLINTSNFTWRKEKMLKDGVAGITIDPSELQENVVHLIAKLCAIGYMLMDSKDRSISKAVVAMDGKQSEVGLSNGRSGKSLVGELFKHIKSSAYINGKKKDFDSDTFIWNEITEKTKIVFVDDLRPNFDFEFLFANITGDWAVNYKGGGRCTVPFNKSAKIYLTTNHALNGEGSSFKDRQWPIAFSDFYNDSHKPINDFGVMFFDEWEFEQWNLTWNLLASCVRLYLKYGYVESPSDRIEVRKIRQFLGEELIAWADEYFSSDNIINTKIPRRTMYDKFLEYAPEQRKWSKASVFKKKILKYCEYRDYTFNPHKYDKTTGLPLNIDKDGRPNIDDKSAGVEYFTIGDRTATKEIIDFGVPYDTED